TLASKTGSGDSVALSKLNPGEAVLMDTDGVHAWTVLMRGRTNSDNEVVNGNFTVSGNSTVNNSTVNGNETIGGSLSVAGPTKISGDTTLSYAAGSQRGVNWAVGTSLRWRLVSDGAAEAGANAGSNLILARYTDAGAYVDNPLTINRATGAFAFGQRPTFNGNAPWDAANFNPGLYALLASPSLSGTPTVNGLAWTGSQFSVRNSAATPWAVSAYCSAQVGGCFIGRTDAASVPLAAWFFGTSNVGTITTNGSTTTYGTGSDYRLKDGIEDLDGDFAVDLLMQGRPRKFWMRADPAKRVNYGFIAHEYAEIQPEAVVGEKDGMGPPMAPPVDDEGNAADMPEEPRYQHMDYSKPTPILWAALKRAIERISALEAALARAG
ncbi:tail fiber domain-containing protein, partial [Paraburkholderia xenovorans]|uniref:tail fiber domain-containing protein n=1 Tax=Paraburkholderia xenovorans TaxID=36873 RepID=UPI00155917BD